MNEFKAIERHIEDYWDQAAVRPDVSRWGNLRNVFMHIGLVRLPHPTVSPNHEYFAGTQYYWDSYFTIIGLLESGRKTEAKAMVDNLAYLFKKFGFFPARNTRLSVGRTQPPFFSRMVWEVYEHGAADDDWLDSRMHMAQTEYEKVWNSGRRLNAAVGLNRYRPQFLRSILTVYESGWDVSTRFALGRTNVIPIDLNCLLYRYEKDIEAWHRLRGREEEAGVWKQKRRQRKAGITKYLWDEDTGFFYDYDADEHERDKLKTVAGYFALWSGVASKRQARQCVAMLDTFRQKYGLASTEKMIWKHRQWDYPNAWPPLQLIVIEGLRRYGYTKEANKQTDIWLRLHASVFAKTGLLWEKYDVVHGKKGRRGRYPTQSGFSWTNGVFLRLRRYQQENTAKN